MNLATNARDLSNTATTTTATATATTTTTIITAFAIIGGGER